MKILLVGDTHGKTDRAKDICIKTGLPDLIVHTGDYIKDAHSLAYELGVDVKAVRGNCDRSRDFDTGVILETEYCDVFLTHGHLYKVKHGLGHLKDEAIKNKCKAVFFGHTHIGMVKKSEGILFVNPGSLTAPRDGSGGSCAIVKISKERMDATIVYYDTIMEKGIKRSVSGFIRKVINRSDRY